MSWLIQRGSTWYIGYRENGKSRYYTTQQTDKTEAETKRLQFDLAQRVQSGKVDEPKPSMLLLELIELYKAQADISPETVRINTYSWKKFMDVSKCVTVGEVTPEVVKAFKKSMIAADASPANTSLCLRDLKKLMGYAIEKGIITKNPCAKIQLPEKEKVARFLTPEEVEALLGAAPPMLRRMMEFTLQTGLRISQVTSLQWAPVEGLPHVNLKDKTLFVPKQKRQKERVVPLFDEQLAALGTPRTEGQVFEGVNTNQTYQVFKRAVRRSGIKGRLRFHDLRHTCASNLIKILRPEQVRDYFGWSSIAMVDIYTHTTTESIRESLLRHRKAA
jgi:integrase